MLSNGVQIGTLTLLTTNATALELTQYHDESGEYPFATI